METIHGQRVMVMVMVMVVVMVMVMVMVMVVVMVMVMVMHTMQQSVLCCHSHRDHRDNH